MKLGLEVLLEKKELKRKLKGKRIALLAHPASVDRNLNHSIDLLANDPDINLVAAFGPQHGMRGDKQDNMVETKDELDSVHQIPVFSLYGEVRRPTPKMLNTFDVVLVDLQDVGCRIYTFLTTLFYLLEDGAREGKAIWVLDRPNPIGRPIEGIILSKAFESFVGGGPIILRHGLTLGEAALWYKAKKSLQVDLEVVKMEDYDPIKPPGLGWPLHELSWVNPSPNIPRLSSTRCFPGTVLIEGTELSEGRGTTRPLELLGAPGIDVQKWLKEIQKLPENWLKGCTLRPCYFEPTFQKHTGKLCAGFQIHVDHQTYSHVEFKPFRLVAGALKSLKRIDPSFKLWREFEYEYESERLAFDLITGTDKIRKWIDSNESKPLELDEMLSADESAWEKERKPFLLY